MGVLGLLLQCPLLLPLLQLCVPALASTPPLYSTPQEPPLLSVILTHTLFEVVCHLNHSLVNYRSLLILGESFEVTDEPRGCLFSDAVHTLTP